jgi:hypothetical protein
LRKKDQEGIFAPFSGKKKQKKTPRFPAFCPEPVAYCYPVGDVFLYFNSRANGIKKPTNEPVTRSSALRSPSIPEGMRNVFICQIGQKVNKNPAGTTLGLRETETLYFEK